MDDIIKPVGGTMLIPDQVIATWTFRRSQIFPGETICGLIVQLMHPDLFNGRDCLWFVDNEAAVSALIRGTCREADVHEIAQSSSLLTAALGARVWYEWIDSDSNPSDGLSRLGLKDPWTVTQPWAVEEFKTPAFLSEPKVLDVFWKMCEMMSTA